MNEKPSLPSIKDLLEGGPGLMDYTSSSRNLDSNNKIIEETYSSRHRRHASENITSNNKNSLVLSKPIPSQPIKEYTPFVYPSNDLSLQNEMQLLSLEKGPTQHLIPPPNSIRNKVHSRSYSDFTYSRIPPVPDSNQLSFDFQHNTINDAKPPPTLPVLLPDLTKKSEPVVIAKEETHSDQEGDEFSKQPSKYICPYCQKGFTRPSSLRTHTYSHTGEKPFACTSCKKKFSVQSNLRRHLRIHRTNKPTTLFLPKNIN